MLKKIFSYTVIMIIPFFIACSKYVSTQPTTTPINTTPGNGTFNSNYAYIKFFNVMDYGGVNVLINDTAVATNVAPYFPSTYLQATKTTTTIKIVFNNATVLTQTFDVLRGNFYSVFVYRVGYDWKMSFIKDILSAPPKGSANIRVLDFRTQAYFDYVKVRFVSPGTGQLDYINRNFLDHTTNSTLTQFQSLTAGNYTTYVFNDSTNLAIFKNINLDSASIYSAILLTPSSLSPAMALNAIKMDVEKHN